MSYGEIDHQPGAEVFYFNKRARQALARDIGERMLRRYSKAMDAYMICSDGAIITVGHRYQRVVRQ